VASAIYIKKVSEEGKRKNYRKLKYFTMQKIYIIFKKNPLIEETKINPSR
jgi:hypothetical protein